MSPPLPFPLSSIYAIKRQHKEEEVRATGLLVEICHEYEIMLAMRKRMK
jgi:hypothetical protein